MRGSLPEAAANALSKGSPRGVTPTHSTASGLNHAASNGAMAAAAAAAGGPAAAAMAKLQKLAVLPPGVAAVGLGAAPTHTIANQGEWVGGWAGCVGGGLSVPRWYLVDPSRPTLASAARCHSNCICVPLSFSTGLHRVDTMGHLMSPSALKKRGLKVPSGAGARAAESWQSECGRLAMQAPSGS